MLFQKLHILPQSLWNVLLLRSTKSTTIECLEKTVSEQKNVIHEKSKQSKELAKSAEDQVAELREELFIVKRERNISNSKINAFQDEIEMLKSDNETIIIEKDRFA